jgi:N-acetylglutamate synthase-like GNAT family acetyltransferase
MTTESSIRAAKATDFAAACHLLEAAGLPIADLTVGHFNDFLVAENPVKLTGLIGLQRLETIGLLRSLVIDSSCRGAGLGRTLVEALELHASTQRITELWLLTKDADRFFAQLGYTVSDRESAPESIASTPEFADLCPGDAVLMRKPLLGLNNGL